MPCCCKDNIEASSVLGIIYTFVCLVLFIGTAATSDESSERYTWLVYGVYGSLVSGLLIFGAKRRNPTAILVWMFFAIIGVILLIILFVLVAMLTAVVHDPAHGDIHMSVYMFMILYVAFILFQIWTIIVAKRAREEIQGEGSDCMSFKKCLSRIPYASFV